MTIIGLEWAEKEKELFQDGGQIKSVKRTSITTVRDQYLSFATFPTPLLFHYPLPLSRIHKTLWLYRDIMCIVQYIVCASLHFGLSHIFIGVNQSTKYWMKVHVKYMFHTVKWAVPQNFRDKFFLLSVDHGFSSFVLKNLRYGNCRLFYIHFKDNSCVVLNITAYRVPTCTKNIYILLGLPVCGQAFPNLRPGS